MDVPIDLTHVRLQTPRLLLRPWLASDLDDLYRYASVPGVGEMAGWQPHQSPQVSEEVLQGWLEKREVLALVLRETGRVIGSLGLHNSSWANEDEAYQALRLKEIGYVLARDHWGRGLMPEAVAAALDLCFGQLALDAVTVSHFTSNHQSQRVIEKMGFALVKVGQTHSAQLGKTFESKKYILYRP